jgi:hypothetical protein
MKMFYCKSILAYTAQVVLLMIWERMYAGISDFKAELPLYINGYKASGERNTLANRLVLWLEIWYCGVVSLLFFTHDPSHLRFAFTASLPFLALAGIHALYVQWRLNNRLSSHA